MSLTTLEIEPFGGVLFARSKRAKRLSITVKPFKPIRVTVPRMVSIKKATRYLILNLEWVKKSVARIKKIEAEHRSISRNSSDICDAKAGQMLVSRLGQLAGLHKLSYNRVSIRKQRTIWGSCSAKNNISLNVNIAYLPEQLQDYVLVHELVHTKVKNHSRKFWAELNKYVQSDAKELSKQMKKYRIRLE
ncbi:M48 family metallopeptidase [Planctomycetota bacterium]